MLAPSSTPPFTPVRATHGPALVLLVEDDRLSQRIVAKIFAKAGHTLVVADSVAAGLDALRQNPFFDLLIVDNHLGTDMGWTLLAEIRRRSYLSDLPVVTYTESRDREVVVRYAELGVQAFHLKPYRSEVLLAELNQAIGSGRRARVVEDPTAVCERLDLTAEDYAGMLSSGATQLEQDCQTIRRLLLSESDPRLGAAVRSICQRLPQLGYPIAATLGRQADLELRKGDYSSCSESLAGLDAIASHVRARATALLEMPGAILQADASSDADVTLSGSRAGQNTPRSGAPSFIDDILAQPIGILGGHVQRLCLSPLFQDGIMPSMALGWRHHAAVKPWFESLLWLDQAESHSPEVVINRLSCLGGYEPVLRHILRRTGAALREDASDWPALVNSIGVPKSAIYAVAGRLGRSTGSPTLDLRSLHLQAITLLLLNFEIGRFFRLTNPHRLAAAGLVRHLGLQTLAASDPLSTSLALAYATHSGDPRLAEREVLGLTFGEAGTRWLVAAGASRLYQDISADYSEADENMMTLLVVRLAEQLIAAVRHPDPTALTHATEALVHPQNEILTSLKALGASLPMETADGVEMLLSLAKSAARIAQEIMHPASGATSAP